jgi:DnaJ-class molecular chaperone
MLFLSQLRETLKRLTAPTCVDCWGVGQRWVQDRHRNLHFTPCRLCRGTGRIVEESPEK